MRRALGVLAGPPQEPPPGGDPQPQGPALHCAGLAATQAALSTRAAQVHTRAPKAAPEVGEVEARWPVSRPLPMRKRKAAQWGQQGTGPSQVQSSHSPQLKATAAACTCQGGAVGSDEGLQTPRSPGGSCILQSHLRPCPDLVSLKPSPSLPAAPHPIPFSLRAQARPVGGTRTCRPTVCPTLSWKPRHRSLQEGPWGREVGTPPPALEPPGRPQHPHTEAEIKPRMEPQTSVL